MSRLAPAGRPHGRFRERERAILLRGSVLLVVLLATGRASLGREDPSRKAPERPGAAPGGAGAAVGAREGSVGGAGSRGAGAVATTESVEPGPRAERPASRDASPPEMPFIRVEGTRFIAGDQPFFFVGANLNLMHGPEARPRYAETIRAAAADGLRVGRVWALGEGVADAPAWQRRDFVFRAGPDGWQEEAYRQLDLVVAEAGRAGLRLVLTLSNSWKDYGGIPAYLRWAGHIDVEAYGYTDRFFSDPKCRSWFAEHVRRLVGRTNSVTGVRYCDDPTIMAWELQNEMHGTHEGAEARRQWVVDMSRLIRSMDPNHLVVPGTIGYKLQAERRDWLLLNQLPEVSYCSQHIYPEEHVLSRTPASLRMFIDDRVQLAHYVVGKPIVFGEFGFDQGPPERQARWHRLFLERLFYNGGNGAMVWIYQPTLPWKRKFGILIDDPRYLPVRKTLGALARRVATTPATNRNARLGPAVGDRPLAPTHALLVNRATLPRRWLQAQDAQRTILDIPVDAYFRAWFEEAGSWDGGILVHAYGRRTGWFEYRFAGPGFIPARLILRARISSEYPGRAAPPHGYSQVRLLLNGGEIATLRAPPDDGLGSWHTVVVEDRALLRRLQRGVHTLRFQVDDGPEANGIALYGRETRLNREPVEEPGPLQLIAERDSTPRPPAAGARAR